MSRLRSLLTRLRRPWMALLVVCALATRALAAPQGGSSVDRIQQVDAHIDALRLEEAESDIEALAAEHPDSPEVGYRRGVLAFYRGDYAQALSLIDHALSGQEVHPRWEAMRALVESTHEVTRGFVSLQSSDGRYRVLHEPGPDSVMASHALEILEAADTAVTQALGLRVPGPIRLEIFPTADALAAVSTLTVEQIETTGTIALSKWDRLMITSPRALVRGYPWADTINHEFVHMVVSRVTGERAPVWLQEGLAKLLERSWKTREPGARLEPASRSLLEDAVRDDKLLTFDEMHPSIAMLPSQEAAALAFAEVATFVDHYAAQHGMDAVRDALHRIESKTDAREALGAAAGRPFGQLERQWKAQLPRGTKSKSPRHIERRLRGSSGKPDDSLDVVEERARRFLRLGDLLWDRRRVKAAAIEYGKAHAADRDDPIVASRFARAALEAGKAAEARDAMESLAQRYPDQAPVHAMLGAARLALGQRQEAAQALGDAILVNPFDPQAQCDLARSSSTEHVRARAQAACERLRE